MHIPSNKYNNIHKTIYSYRTDHENQQTQGTMSMANGKFNTAVEQNEDAGTSNDGPVLTQSSVQDCGSATLVYQYLHICAREPHEASYIKEVPKQASYTQQTPIIGQQPKLAINGTRTPKASFSETEESNKSDDNDDRLSWEEVRGRGRKRPSLEKTRVLILKKNKLQETSNTPTQLTATNKFEAL